jgi:hypothetical protein
MEALPSAATEEMKRFADAVGLVSVLASGGYPMPDPRKTSFESKNRDAEGIPVVGFRDQEWEMVSIYWVDAESDGGTGWQDPEEMIEFAKRPLPVMHTVGLLVFECDHYIAVTDSKGPEEMGSVTKIPLGWIQQYDRLGVVASKLPRLQGPGLELGEQGMAG